MAKCGPQAASGRLLVNLLASHLMHRACEVMDTLAGVLISGSFVGKACSLPCWFGKLSAPPSNALNDLLKNQKDYSVLLVVPLLLCPFGSRITVDMDYLLAVQVCCNTASSFLLCRLLLILLTVCRGVEDCPGVTAPCAFILPPRRRSSSGSCKAPAARWRPG